MDVVEKRMTTGMCISIAAGTFADNRGQIDAALGVGCGVWA